MKRATNACITWFLANKKNAGEPERETERSVDRARKNER